MRTDSEFHFDWMSLESFPILSETIPCLVPGVYETDGWTSGGSHLRVKRLQDNLKSRLLSLYLTTAYEFPTGNLILFEGVFVQFLIPLVDVNDS